MPDVYFNVAHEGTHVFRTDIYNDPQSVERMREHLRQQFRPEDGYEVTESWRTATWNTREVN